MTSRLLVVLALVTAPAAPAQGQGPEGTVGPRAFAAASNAFGLDLYQRLRESPGNLVVSPASITTALVMPWAGARGDTAAEMGTALRMTAPPAEAARAAGGLAASLQDPARPVVFRIANRLFGEQRYRFEPAFLDGMRAAFGAPLQSLDFRRAPEQARERINAWVEERTERRIRDLVPPQGVDGETRLVLVNAIYFLGDWAEPFAREATRPAPFHLSAAERRETPTMHRTGTVRYARRDGVEAVELPYRGGSLAMLLLVPERVDGLAAAEAALTAERLEAIVRALGPTRVALAVPRFEVSPGASLPLADQLKAMGLRAAFDRRRADFRGIADPPDPADRLFIGNVFHKAFVRVDEKGTEAAAATAVVMPRAAGVVPAPPLEVKADRPFLYLIRDPQSGLVLFLGRVADPTAR